MSVCEKWIELITEKLPDTCTTSQLVLIGIYTSPHSACMDRKAKKSPPYFKLGKRIVYPKEGIIQWLREQKYENTQTKIQ